jgi:hypothetical protein
MPLRVLSLGAGVQSTAMLLMGLRGEFGEPPDVAIFADTQWEPRTVYDHLAWLEREVAPFPILRVTAGDIRANTLRQDVRSAQPPLYVLSSGSARETMIRRQCTKGYKIEPIQKKVRELIGLKPRQRSPKEAVVEQWIGISLDEVQRMKPNPERYIDNRWPLIELGMSRHDCLGWLDRNGYPEPPKSACIGCPYHANPQWRAMRDTDPDSWRDAVEFDREIRRVGIRKIEGEPYLHRSLKPLDEVDLRTDEDLGQMSMFTDECEGMCGV